MEMEVETINADEESSNEESSYFDNIFNVVDSVTGELWFNNYVVLQGCINKS